MSLSSGTQLFLIQLPTELKKFPTALKNPPTSPQKESFIPSWIALLILLAVSPPFWSR